MSPAIQEMLLRFGVEAVALLAGLWLIVLVLRFDWTVLGLLVTTIIGAALDQVPYAGHFIAIPFLFFCCARLTHGELPGIVLTVIVAYGFMLCSGLYLTPTVAKRFNIVLASTHGESKGTNDVVHANVAHASVAATNKIAPEPPPTPPPPPPVANEVPEEPKVAPLIIHSSKTVSQSPTVSPEAARELVKKFTLKSVINNPGSSVATIHTGTKTYVIELKESRLVETPSGQVRILVEQVTDKSIVLNVYGSRVQLNLPD